MNGTRGVGGAQKKGPVRPHRTSKTDRIDERDALFLGSVAKTFEVLEVFNAERRSLGLSELTRLCGLQASAVQRIVHTLKTLGYLQQNPRNRTLSLAGRMLEFGHTILATHWGRACSLPHLQHLRATTGGSVNLLQLEGSEVINIARFPARDDAWTSFHVGSRLPAFCTSSGRALMARMKAEQALQILQNASRTAWTAHTITDLSKLLDKLREGREVGYCVTREEVFPGDLAFSAPIIKRDGTAMLAINVSLPMASWDYLAAQQQVVPRLLETAAAISKSI